MPNDNKEYDKRIAYKPSIANIREKYKQYYQRGSSLNRKTSTIIIKTDVVNSTRPITK